MSNRSRLAILLAVGCATGAPRGTAADQKQPAGARLNVQLKQWRLGNGLRVIFSPHRRVPAVTVQVWYHVGSKNERRDARGVAHMFEHMMFKGTKRVPPDRHAQMLSSIGGTVNAFTTEDLTAYHNTLPAQYLEFAMKLEAERMRNLLLTDKAIKSEREVVKEEKRKRLDNNPIGRALEAIRALTFKRHPYSWTAAGEIGDLNRTTKRTYQSFYDTYYRPNNATLVVVGDVAEARVRRAAQRHFGSIKRGKAPPRVSVVEPPQRALRLKRASWPSQFNVVLGAYHIPAARHRDVPALNVLSAILSAGRSSRLHQALVRKGKLALAAGGFVREFEHPGVFLIYAVGLPRHGQEKMKKTLLAELGKVVSGGVSASELTKAKNQLAVGRLRGLRTVWGLAQQIGMSTYVDGDPRAFLDEVAKIDRVSAADVKRVASTYLKQTNLNLVLLPAREQGQGGGR